MNAEQATHEDGSPIAEAHNTQGKKTLRRYSAGERRQLLQEYEASGMTRQEFCAARGIKPTTFHGWFKKRMRQVESGFAEVELSAEEAAAPIEIGLPNGKRLGIYLNGNQDELVQLIRGVLQC